MDGRRAGQASVGDDAREDEVHEEVVEEIEHWRPREYWFKSSGSGACSVTVSPGAEEVDRKKDVPEGH